MKILFLALCISISSAHAVVKLAPLFTDNAVLQRDKPVTVWGWADPGEEVTVAFKEQKQQATANGEGRWKLELPSMKASVEGADMTVSGTNTIVLHNIVVGEVWLGSGQSNMAFALQGTTGADKEIASANFPLIRQFLVPQSVSETPQDGKAPWEGAFNQGRWAPASPETVARFTAFGYYFAKSIYEQLKVPVGIINASWGGTLVQAWSPAEVVAQPCGDEVRRDWEATMRKYPEAKKTYDAALAAWQEKETAAKAAGQKLRDRKPREPEGPGYKNSPSGLFNAMIHPLVPYTLRGILWYQGESNTSRPPRDYGAMFSGLITSWRHYFAQGDIPFYWVQLPNQKSLGVDKAERAEMREKQDQALALPATASAVTIDIGDVMDNHPKNKKDFSERMARIAKALTYGLPGEYSGPRFQKAERQGNTMRATFTHTTGGLVAKKEPLTDFQIAGPDKVFHPAEARIEGSAVIVSSSTVPEPVAVRYAWRNAPEASLFNGEGLPAAPFRSDDWPLAGAEIRQTSATEE